MSSKFQKKPKGEMKHGVAWKCCDAEFGSNKEMIEHLKTAHGITEPKGNKHMAMCMDFAHGEYANSYTWTFDGGVTATQCLYGRREKA